LFHIAYSDPQETEHQGTVCRKDIQLGGEIRYYSQQEDNSPQHRSQDQIVATILLGLLYSHPDIFLFAHAAEPVKADLVAFRIDDVTFEASGRAMVTGLYNNQIEIDRHVFTWRKV
jgi:hypothetical protein